MKENNKGFFSQRTFNIFFSGVFVFIMAMMFKEKLETPENYLENVKKSEIIAREKLAPSLKEIFKSNSISEGRTSRGSSSLRYGIMFEDSEPPRDCRRLNILREYDNPGAVQVLRMQGLKRI